MTVGNIPPSSSSEGYYNSGGGQFQNCAQYSLLHGLSSAVPALDSPDINTLDQNQQNTYWFLRGYSDLMQLWAVESLGSTAYNGQNGVMNFQDAINQLTGDLQYILNINSGNPSLGTQFIQDIQTTISQPSSIVTDGPTLEDNYVLTLAGTPPAGYPQPGALDLTNLAPDDTFYYYTAQLAFAATPAGLIVGDGTFWANPQGGPTEMTSSLDQFMCTYFYEMSLDAKGQIDPTTLTANYNSWFSIMSPIMSSITTNPSNFPNLSKAVGAPNVKGTLMNDMMELANNPSAWSSLFSLPPPSSPDNLPSFSWGTQPSTPNFTYGEDPYLGMVDDWLASQFQGA